MHRLLGFTLALAGCLKPSSTTCKEGWTCPNGLACAPAGVFCAAKSDLDACVASTVDAHDTCSTADIGSGVCIAKVCRPCETDYEGCSVATWTAMGYSGDELKSVWLSDRRTAIAVGKAGTVARYDGTGWTTMTIGASDYLGVAVADKPYALFATEVAALGDVATPVHTGPAGATYRGMWASGSNAFAVGNMGTISHYDGAAWSDQAIGSGAPSLFGVGGSSLADVWVVGAGGTVWHATAGTFALVTGLPVVGSLRAVWSSSPSDVFIVGSPSIVLHYDGAAWSQMTLPATVNIGLISVWGSGPNDVWALGNDASGIGQIFHFDGGQWTVAASSQPTLDALMGVGSDVFAVGKSIVLRNSP